jgi:hypothetical protein
MKRGFVKLWYKIKDNDSYLRGGVHRAVLLTLFVEANVKSELFRGEEVTQGQLAITMSGLARDLGFPRTTVKNVLYDLAKDGVITLENIGNKWSRITLNHWTLYQPEYKVSKASKNPQTTNRQPTDNQQTTDSEIFEEVTYKSEQPTDNQQTTNRQPTTLHHIKDIKDIKIKDINIINPPLSPLPSKKSSEPKETFGEFENVQLTLTEYDKLVTAFGEFEAKERIDRLSEYLASKGGKYKSHYATILSWARRDEKDSRASPRRPIATTVSQQRYQDQQAMARMILIDRQQRKNSYETGTDGKRYVTDTDGTRLALPPGW